MPLLTEMPREILVQIVHHPVLSLTDQKNLGKTCKLLDEIEHDEVAYCVLVRRNTGLTTLPATAGGRWETQMKLAMRAPQRSVGIDARRMGLVEFDAFYDECSNQEGWD